MLNLAWLLQSNLTQQENLEVHKKINLIQQENLELRQKVIA